MKKILLITLFILAICIQVHGNGVAIVDAENAVYLRLIESIVEVNVESQVAVIKTQQVFKNSYNGDRIIKYAFPLPGTANATSLRWLLAGAWYEASIAPVPQDTTMPGPPGKLHPDLKSYLGETPLFYDLTDPVRKDSLVIIELTYVQLLSYEFGKVNFTYPNDYRLIQSTFVEKQELDFTLTSPRTIDSLQLISNHANVTINNEGYSATLQSLTFEVPATEDYHVQYTLSLDELGLFSFSTLLPFELIPDSYGGFFVFVAEPDPSETTDVINKYFTLIIDRSGSMYGNKMTQAKNAAEFIVNNLNEGDWFNIISFASDVTSFRPAHVPFNTSNKEDALAFISSLRASGGTNISGAFDEAVPQFSVASDSTSNIIIFLTDGQPTVGITNKDALVSHINNLVIQTETDLAIFNFGIGNDVNQQLLIRIANDNKGFAEFLGNDDLEERITEFYLKIRNPVLLNTTMHFSSMVISETYPRVLPNLYKGQQMIVAGRYLEPIPVDVTLSGMAFGDTVRYAYALDLADSTVQKYQFLPKIWAKMKIDHLLVQYYILDPESAEAKAIKDQIIEISLGYGVISPFTSFSDPTDVEDNEKPAPLATQFELLGNYPNPFNSTTVIQFRVHGSLNELVKIKIYDSLGRLITLLTIEVRGPGVYEVLWNGLTREGKAAASGQYFYLVDFSGGILAGKMQLVK